MHIQIFFSFCFPYKKIVDFGDLKPQSQISITISYSAHPPEFAASANVLAVS